MGKPKLFLIDATAFCYRAFYALPQLATSFGQPTNAIYGFMNILNKILKHEKPQYLAICFDVSRDTFRQKKFAEYKIQRPPMPDGLTSQIPLIKEIIRAYALPLFEKAGFEADDIIATIAAKAKGLGLPVVVVSSDKDMLQLVDDSIEVYSPYKDEGIFYNEEKVRERFGVSPKGITDIIALMGDSADNLPGVPGIGEKTAASLIVQFGNLDKLLDNIDKIQQEKIRKTITEHLDGIKLSKELALLDNKVDIDFELDKLKIGEPDYKKLFDLFKRLEFKKFLKDLPLEEEEPAQDNKSALVEDKELVGLMRGQDRLVFYGESLKGLVYSAGNKVFQVDRAGRDLKAILSEPKVKKISHDLKKLKVSLAGEGVSLEGLYFDVMIAAYLLSPSKAGYDLSDIALDYSAKCLPKIIEKQKAVELIIELEPRLEKELEAKALTGLFRDIEMPLVEVLSEMELVGIKLDREALLKLSQDIEKRLVKLIEEIYEASGTQFNINSPKQLREILFEKLKLPVARKSKTGPSTDEEVLRKLSSKHKLPALLLEYRQLTKLKNTYIDALPELIDKKTGRIHTSFNQTGTETGRLSSSNPNLQNIPVKTDIGRLIRKAIISSGEKNYLLSCDYSQVELRILAHLSGDQNLISAFKEDRDIHRATAALIYGMDEKEVLDKMREVAKRVNFGIVYGLSSYGLSRDLGISAEEAQSFIDAYFLRYPKVKDYIEEQISRCQKDGFVTTILGRKRYIPEINNKNQGIRSFAQRQAVNTPIQGSAADLIKLAMIQIHEQIKTRGLDSKMILQIHDELLFDAPEQELDKLIVLVKDRMENVLKLDVPVKVDIKKGRNWLEMEEIK